MQDQQFYKEPRHVVQEKTKKAILGRTKRAAIGAMCRRKLVDEETNQELLVMLGLKEIIDVWATVNGVRRCGHVVRKVDDSALNMALGLRS